ncbi:hypothetical protein [Idiomarina aminovorans]|uniref:hypothetical protein n=1 Tax=Idiomarina aminovorans TaxID=2914829 RepID=UPI0020035C70|nr:hypothetical protein [Idiomarina sp. ATCH4]MCK7460200.1 hypothetical protein [Idiomarina sp. ATCH4]
MSDNNDADASNIISDDNESIDPWADPVKETKLLNFFIVFAIAVFAAGHFFNVVEVKMWGQTETMGIASEMSSGELTFFISCCAVAIATALTGVFPMAAKVVVGYFLITYGTIFYDIFSEASEASETLSMMGVNLSRSQGWEKLLGYLGAGAYLVVGGMILMFLSLFIRLKTRKVPIDSSFGDSSKVRAKAGVVLERSSGILSKYIEVVNLHIAEIKLLLKEHDATESLDALKRGVDKVKKSASDKDLALGCDGLYELIKNSLGYMAGFIKTVFTANNTGKVLVVFGVVMVYNLIF